MGLFDSIKKAFDDIDDPKSASAAHILMKSRIQALLLKEEIDAGEIHFAEAARQHSTCTSGGKGGNLGQFRPGKMVPAFDALVFDPHTQIGQVNVCSTQFGTHLVKVIARTGVPPAAPAEAAAFAAAEAAAAEVDVMDPLRAAAEVAAAEAAAIAAAADTPAGELMEVICPAELAADRTIRIALQDAREFDVIVPAGVAPGDAFLVGPFPDG